MPPELATLRDVLRWAVSRFNAAGLHFGHGSTSAYDEAAYLLLHALRLPPDRLEPFLDARLSAAELEALDALLARRIEERLPAAYLTHEAWLGDYRFYVDERVIVPRSHIAGLLFEGALAPWLGEPEALESALDLCAGSGCLAVLLALTFPRARVDGVDISAAALEVAARNVADYGLEARIELVRSDLFAGLEGRRYDLIVSNPPYVTGAAMRALPAEYRHEPTLALAAGEDGLDIIRRILAEAPRHLQPDGILLVEVGGNSAIVESAFPNLPFAWLESDDGDGAVFLLERAQLQS
ncbi:MAG: 50S ribosomal protein L3 N(5)-glutamine methyltransferase [Rhodocyclaceae bacterium]|nr:50S ribosomal protein L3 N(5)-glutamine methyltransferase [Rhodocyclaceae bacterium]